MPHFFSSLFFLKTMSSAAGTASQNGRHSPATTSLPCPPRNAGTSLPDTFASSLAAIYDDTADAVRAAEVQWGALEGFGWCGQLQGPPWRASQLPWRCSSMGEGSSQPYSPPSTTSNSPACPPLCPLHPPPLPHRRPLETSPDPTVSMCTWGWGSLGRSPLLDQPAQQPCDVLGAGSLPPLHGEPPMRPSAATHLFRSCCSSVLPKSHPMSAHSRLCPAGLLPACTTMCG